MRWTTVLRNASDRVAMLATLAPLDVEAYLRAGGLGDADLAVRARLLGPTVDATAASEARASDAGTDGGAR
jgi:hypothetical protein